MISLVETETSPRSCGTRNSRSGPQPLSLRTPYPRFSDARVGSRFYDNKVGRWTTPDPLGVDAGLNTYTFCNNNPIMFVDIYGLSHTWGWTWWDLNPIQSYFHIFYDFGATAGEPMAKLFSEGPEAMKEGDRRGREHDKIFDEHNQECPTQEDSVQKGISKVRDITKDLGSMPGTGMGGPPPIPPLTGEEVAAHLISGGVNRGLGAMNDQSTLRSTAP